MLTLDAISGWQNKVEEGGLYNWRRGESRFNKRDKSQEPKSYQMGHIFRFGLFIEFDFHISFIFWILFAKISYKLSYIFKFAIRTASYFH